MWHIVQNSNIQFNELFVGIGDIPYTFSYLIRKRMQIDSWMELPKDKRPPECLDKMTKVFIKVDNLVKQVSLIDLLDTWKSVLIMTPNGWKNILNYRINTQDALLLRFACLDSVVCSYNHHFPLSNRKAKEVYLLKAEDIEMDTNYYKFYGLFRTIDKFLDDPIQEFNGRKLDYDLGFIVGLYAAEGGGKFNRIILTINDNERYLIDKIKPKLLEFGICEVPFLDRISDGKFKCGKHNSDVGKRLLRVKISSRELSFILRYFVYGVCKSKKLNKLFLNCPIDFRKGIFDGLLAGDGCVLGGDRFSFDSASEQLRDDLATLASSVGMLTSKYYHKTYDVRYNRYYASYVLHSRIGRCGITRKINDNYQLPLRNKDMIGKVEMVDIEVDDGLFIIGDGLISHNSIWDKPDELEEWFDRVFDSDAQTEFNITYDENEVEK